MNNRVLFYADPHPVRNTFFEFEHVAKKMCDIGTDKAFRNIEWRLFSNNFILDNVAKTVEERFLLRPTDEEDQHIFSLLAEWNRHEIDRRTDLINQTGPLFELYYSILSRIKTDFDFTHVVLWSENGAVRKFVEDNNLGIIHMELGPTRRPFKETVYLDPFGTNGNSSISQTSITSLPSAATVPLDTWLSDSLIHATETKSARELSQIPLSEDYSNLLDKNYVVIALQLADDLNTLMHSDFDSPKRFLEKVLPPLLARNFDVLIKGHPAVALRPFNLAMETEALAYAQSLNNRVVVLDRKLSTDKFIPLCANAQAVLSINSSVSFESWLLGTPGFVFGRPAYDMEDHIYRLSEDFLRSGEKKNRRCFKNILVHVQALFDTK